MTVPDQIKEYIDSQAESKRVDMLFLHNLITKSKPSPKLWFLDGRNSENKVVSNPNIGYGMLTMKYTNGSTREFYQLGLSANQTGISIYVMGVDDKKLLADKFGKRLGKATVTGYCIKFKSLKDLDAKVLEELVKFALAKK